MNTGRKGARVENIAIQQLVREGYSVDRTHRSTYRTAAGTRSNKNDFWGAFDLIARKPGVPWRLVQVTAGKSIASRKAKILAVGPYDERFESVEIWRWVGGSGPRKDMRTGEPRPRFYFQVYHAANHFRASKEDRVFCTQ